MNRTYLVLAVAASALIAAVLITTVAWAAPEASTMTAKTAPRVKTSMPTTIYSEGPATTDRSAVMPWLGAHIGRQVRLPVAIMHGPVGRIQWATLAGMIDGDGTPDGPALRLDDSRLGIALATHLDRMCPAASGLCVVWLEGLWQAPGIGFDPSPVEGAKRFVLTRVGGPVTRSEVPRVGAAQPREKAKTSVGPARRR